MDIRKVKQLMEMLEESSLSEMEIIEGEESIRLSKSSSVMLENNVALPSSNVKNIVNQEKITNTC